MSRRVTVAYRGGTVTVELVPIDDEGHELEAGAAAAWGFMAHAAELDGVTLRARTAFRDYDFQKRLFEAYERYRNYTEKVMLWQAGGQVGPEPERAPWAALANKPGTSTHEIGNAVDVEGAAQEGGKIDLWLTANAQRFGFKRTVPSERWHYNWQG